MLDVVMSAIIRGNVEYVRQYIDDSAECDIFLHGVEAWDIHCPNNDGNPSDDNANHSRSPDAEHVQIAGKTALYFAACEMYPQVLELLLQRGADPIAADVHSRVPLTEAALWGRLENVQVLLKSGAEKELECVRDGPRLRAIDFARPLRVNAQERYFRSGSEHQVYKENAYEGDLDRKTIVRLLEDEAKKPSQDLQVFGVHELN